MMVGLIAGFLYLPRLVQRLGTQRTLYLAYAGFVFVTVLNATLAEWVPPSLIHLLPIAAYALAIGLSMPLLVGQALQPFPDNAESWPRKTEQSDEGGHCSWGRGYRP